MERRTDNGGDIILRTFQRREVFLYDVGGGKVANLLGETELLRPVLQVCE